MYSFDVFDTLITRTTADPWGIFALMRKRMKEERGTNGLDEYIIENFYELRIHSEELARRAAAYQQTEEVTLKDIYAAMAVCGCLGEEQKEYLCRLEQEMEIANVVGIPENIERVKELLKRGGRVILVSDMYLPTEAIRAMLLKADPVFENIPLYVSAQYGKRKTTGNLYRYVQKAEGIGFEDWVHVGDNIHQDIEVPFLLGITPKLAERTELNIFEKEQLERYGDDVGLQLMIGTAKRTDRRIAADAYHAGCRYAGPVLYSYAEWLVEQAVKRRVKRLYFIARDGYLIKKIVDIILSGKKTGVTTSYIYGSRAVWRMASLSEENYNLYQMILWSHYRRIMTLADLAKVLHLPLEELYEYLPGIYVERKTNDRVSQQELEYIVGRLSEEDAFRKHHLKSLADERRLAREYLAQVLDLSDDAFAFVDVGGGGLTQGCLRELIKDWYGKPIHTFFFKIDRVNLVKDSLTDTFMPGYLKNDLIIEMLCRAPHGTTKGYRAENGKIVPTLEEEESRLLIEHGFYDYEKGIVDFSREMRAVSERCGVRIASVKNVLNYLKYIGERPSEDVLEYFASMPTSETGRDKKVGEYAPKLTRQEIKEIFLTRGNAPFENFYHGTDINYSVMRATEEEKALIERYKKENGGVLGRLYRQESDKALREVQKRYKRAAGYPVRLLEKRLVVYGAGKFGQDLHKRLAEDTEHEVVLWVDKNVDACRKQGMTDVHDVTEIEGVEYDQIVIAVMDNKLAVSIEDELNQLGISREKIIWLPSNQAVEWKTKGIG